MLLKQLFTHSSLYPQVKNFSIELFSVCCPRVGKFLQNKTEIEESSRVRGKHSPGAIGSAQIYRFLLVCNDFGEVGRNFQSLTMDNVGGQWTSTKVVNKCFESYSRSIQNELAKQIRMLYTQIHMWRQATSLSPHEIYENSCLNNLTE